MAKIVGVFGVKGQVKILSFCQEPTDLNKYQLFDQNHNKISIKITSIKKKTNSKNEILIAQINDITDRNLAEKLVGNEIFVNRQDFQNLQDDEFYYVDLIGLKVLDFEKKQELGFVKNVFDFGGGGIIEIEFNDDVLETKKFNKVENFSFKNEFFPEVNIKSNYLTLKTPEYIESNTKSNL